MTFDSAWKTFYVIAADKELVVTVQPHYKTSVMELLVAVLQLELHNKETSVYFA